MPRRRQLSARCCFALVLATFVLSPGAWASLIIFDQGPFNASLGARNSNTIPNLGSDQQVADDFLIQRGGFDIDRIGLWFTYQDDAQPPEMQELIVRVFNDVDGDPGEIIYQETVSILPSPVMGGEETEVRNAFDNIIYFVEVALAGVLTVEEETPYWLSPIGANDDVTWQWQLRDEELGERRTRGGVGGPEWREFEGNFAFTLIPEPSSLALLGIFVLTIGARRSRG